jgi:hypothetical protein
MIDVYVKVNYGAQKSPASLRLAGLLAGNGACDWLFIAHAVQHLLHLDLVVADGADGNGF